MKNSDVKVEVKNNCICISGERKSESKSGTPGKGNYRCERSYGAVCVLFVVLAAVFRN